MSKPSRVLMIKGLDELVKLDATCPRESFRFVVYGAKCIPRSRILLGGYPKRKPVVVKGTPDFVAMCWLKDGEVLPPELPAVEKVFW
jgi:hypothetical protein